MSIQSHGIYKVFLDVKVPYTKMAWEMLQLLMVRNTLASRAVQRQGNPNSG